MNMQVSTVEHQQIVACVLKATENIFSKNINKYNFLLFPLSKFRCLFRK